MKGMYGYRGITIIYSLGFATNFSNHCTTMQENAVNHILLLGDSPAPFFHLKPTQSMVSLAWGGVKCHTKVKNSVSGKIRIKKMNNTFLHSH